MQQDMHQNVIDEKTATNTAFNSASGSLQQLVRDEVNCLKRAGAATREAGKRHARKISQIVLDIANWSGCHYKSLPQWLQVIGVCSILAVFKILIYQDNDYLHAGHRPQLACFKTCALSIFRLHTETGNIWSHLLGCLLTIGLSCYMYWFAPYAGKIN